MNDTIDLKQRVRLTLNEAKRQLVEEGELLPSAVILGAENTIVAMHAFPSWQAKQAAGRKISEIARKTNAYAVIMIFDARMKSVDWEKQEEFKKNYHQGDLAREQAQETVAVTVKAKDHVWMLMAPYLRTTSGEIAFMETREVEGGAGDISLVPNWW